MTIAIDRRIKPLVFFIVILVCLNCYVILFPCLFPIVYNTPYTV